MEKDSKVSIGLMLSKTLLNNIFIFKVAKEAANRWTDNVYAVKTWCKNKFNMEENALNKNFGIPEDFDYL